MDKDSFKKIIDLISKTGDRCVVLNENGQSFVIMRIKDYEDLIFAQSGVSGLTEEELLDKINREIAIWKSNAEEDVLDKFDVYSGLKAEPEKEEEYYLEPL